MGIFSKLFQRFKKSIHMDESNIHLVYLHPSSKFDFNTTIEIKSDYNAVFVARGKVCDVIYPGRFNLNPTIVPGVYQRLNLDNARGRKQPDSIKAELYYVNVVEFSNVPYYATQPFVFRSKTFKRVKGYPEGTFSIRVTAPDDFIRFLLIENPVIRNGRAISYIQRFVGNEIAYTLENIRMSFEEILDDTPKACQLINEQLLDRFESIGISVYDVKLSSLEVPDKVEKKIEQYLKSDVVDNNNIQEELPPEPPVEDKSGLDKSIEQFAKKNENVRYCPNCGTRLNEDYKFCPNCGHEKE